MASYQKTHQEIERLVIALIMGNSSSSKEGGSTTAEQQDQEHQQDSGTEEEQLLRRVFNDLKGSSVTNDEMDSSTAKLLSASTAGADEGVVLKVWKASVQVSWALDPASSKGHRKAIRGPNVARWNAAAKLLQNVGSLSESLLSSGTGSLLPPRPQREKLRNSLTLELLDRGNVSLEQFVTLAGHSLNYLLKLGEAGDELQELGAALYQSAPSAPSPDSPLSSWAQNQCPGFTSVICAALFAALSAIGAEDDADANADPEAAVGDASANDKKVKRVDSPMKVVWSVAAAMGFVGLPTILFSAKENGFALSRLLTQSSGYRDATLLVVDCFEVAQVGSADAVPSTLQLAALLPVELKSQTSWTGSKDTQLLSIAPKFIRIPACNESPLYCYSQGGRSKPLSAKDLPEGLGFGGATSKFRVFVNAEFESGTLRSWHGDTKFAPGPLLEGQGGAPINFKISNVTLYGLGGQSALEARRAHQKRQIQISEQRRKVDRSLLAEEWKAGAGDRAIFDMVAAPGGQGHVPASELRKGNNG